MAGEVFAALILVFLIAGTLVEYLLASELDFLVFNELIKSDANQRLWRT